MYYLCYRMLINGYMGDKVCRLTNYRNVLFTFQKQIKVASAKVSERKPAAANAAEDLSWKTVIYEYTQNTTIHGVRYITENSVFTVRR